MESNSTSIQELYDLISSDDFRQLHIELGRFNPFQVLAIENAEIRHSNVLAWLLNPNETHGLRDSILRGVIGHVVISNDLTPEEFELENTYFADFNDAEVSREWHNIDILVVSESTETVVIIENKVLSDESKDQLSNYYNSVSSTYPSFRILPIFLTMDGHEAKNDSRYLGLSHRDVVEVISSELQANSARIPLEIETFINQYLEVVRRLLGMDEKVEKLCRRILSEHSVAIKTIMEVAQSKRYALDSAAEAFTKDHEELISTGCNSKNAWFALRAWQPFKGKTEKWNSGYPVSLWFTEYYEKLKVVLEVGPIEPAKTRVMFIEHIELNGFKVSDRAKRLEAMYTRVFTKYLEIKDWEDTDELCSKLDELYKDARKSVELITKSLASFQW